MTTTLVTEKPIIFFDPDWRCKSARNFDADRQAKYLNYVKSAGLKLDAESHPEEDGGCRHWAAVVLDPDAGLPDNRRYDLSDIEPMWFIEVLKNA